MPNEKLLHGLDALHEIGMPHEFAAQLQLVANEFGVAFAIRATLPFQLYSFPSAPKPSFVKEKISNWGLTKGVLPKDVRLGKYTSDWSCINSKLSRAEGIDYIQHKITLHDLLIGSSRNPPEFNIKIVNDDLFITVMTGYGPEDFHPTFKINLHNSSITPKIDEQYICNSPKTELKEPSWWKTGWGDFEKKIRQRYPVEYSVNGEPFTKVMIQAILDKNEMELLPITGDMDILWVSIPNKANTAYETLNKIAAKYGFNLNEVINTYQSPEQSVRLYGMLNLLNSTTSTKFFQDPVSDFKKIEKSGCITPFEAHLIDKINRQFNYLVEHIQRLFQHGPENRNPGEPSNLNGRILHVWKGEFYLTESEQDLVDFVLKTPGYLAANSIVIHDKWNKDLWAPVIAKQVLEQNHQELKQKREERKKKNKTLADFSSSSSSSNDDLPKVSPNTSSDDLPKASFDNNDDSVTGKINPEKRTNLKKIFTKVTQDIPEKIKAFCHFIQTNSFEKKFLFFSSNDSHVAAYDPEKPLITVSRKKSLAFSIKDSFVENITTTKLKELCQTETNEKEKWSLLSNKELKIIIADKNNRPREEIQLFLTSDTIEIFGDTFNENISQIITKITQNLSMLEEINVFGQNKHDAMEIQHLINALAHPTVTYDLI